MVSTDFNSGTQSPFWRRQGNPTGAYWGVTTIQRQGFTPPTSLTGGDFLPNERLQSSRLGRTVIGQAQPGTVVRLIRGFNTNVVGQILVDSSRVFRFENVIVSNEGEFGSNYRLLLYPNGQLTADPQVRDVTFTTVPGQLPCGSATYAGAPTTLGQLIWRYQSTLLQSEFGYGWSGFGRGANAGLGVTLSPGLQLMGRYQGISAFTNRENFSLELQSTLDFQGGSVATNRVEDLRTRGGIAIQPFFDRNGNGKQDPGEASYWHSELVTLDNKALNPSQTTRLPDRVEIRSFPGSYRLDLHPARLPPGWRNALTDSLGKPLESLRVNVALGSYTTISIPLIPIYKITGIVSDATDKPRPGAEVTAVHISGTSVRRTTAKADGSYEFTNLALGEYEISTPGQLQPTKIAIVASSPVLQRFDLRQAAIGNVVSYPQLAIDNCGIIIFTNCLQGF